MQGMAVMPHAFVYTGWAAGVVAPPRTHADTMLARLRLMAVCSAVLTAPSWTPPLQIMAWMG